MLAYSRYPDWHAASGDPLFVRKRAQTLARLLDAKRTFQALEWKNTGAQLLEHVLKHPNGLRTLSVALQEVRKAGLSSKVADVSVCGAVAPYNLLLGGKLVALLMASKEVRDAYRSRYGDQVSMISSQMAGRPIFRPAELKILTTTSLYGGGSSQYNRLRLTRAQFPQLDFDLQWKELAKTAGYGTVHLGATTVRVLREVSERIHRARRINHRFGEGASPRLRQIREALDALGTPCFLISLAGYTDLNGRVVTVTAGPQRPPDDDEDPSGDWYEFHAEWWDAAFGAGGNQPFAQRRNLKPLIPPRGFLLTS